MSKRIFARGAGLAAHACAWWRCSTSRRSATGAQLSPGSGDALENDALETAVRADLTR
ncbi:hypothetical protein [Solimonas sp. K1W22B-7]|uniref:hypothetical protein n=1 Tax=Solimonas sp. K1W22B-7 TaxID=2303331 RepID=UPI0013C473EE|nr:hypothetical protein [Solimonas sp. K1W22B-7]